MSAEDYELMKSRGTNNVQKNPAAVALGRLGAGIPKTITKAESKRRAVRLAAIRYRGGRKPGATNLATRDDNIQ